uniref:cellulose binding domain-containing protein n=1 Tax=Saccharothrix mutabilis TaxID=33921 RepID=UPI0031D9D8DD
MGYLGWSWSGNGGGVEYLDLVNGFNGSSLTPWGQRFFNGTDGVKATAREASVYGGSTPPPADTTCAVTYRVTNQWTGGFQGEVTVRNTGTSALTGWTLEWTFANGERVTQVWNAVGAQNGNLVTARNESWNATLAPGAAVTPGFTATGTPGTPTAFTLNGSTCARS